MLSRLAVGICSRPQLSPLVFCRTAYQESRAKVAGPDAPYPKSLNAQRKTKKLKIKYLGKALRGVHRTAYRITVSGVEKALEKETIARAVEKRAYRKLHMERVDAACRDHGTRYFVFMDGLSRLYNLLNRQSLSELAIQEPRTFRALVELSLCRKKYEKGINYREGVDGCNVYDIPLGPVPPSSRNRRTGVVRHRDPLAAFQEANRPFPE